VAGHLNVEGLSSAHGVTIEGLEKDAPFLIVKDPPEHTAHRKIVARLFTPRRITEMEPFIRRTEAMNTPVEDEEGGATWMLTDDELAGRFLELAFAGHETVAKLIPNGVVALAWFPDARRELVANPALMPDAVEEMLLWDPPSHYQGRWTTRDLLVRDTVIPAGQRVILVTAAAVHDERKYPDPDRLDIHRDIDRHVSFGFGRHLCLGPPWPGWRRGWRSRSCSSASPTSPSTPPGSSARSTSTCADCPGSRCSWGPDDRLRGAGCAGWPCRPRCRRRWRPARRSPSCRWPPATCRTSRCPG
jgi:cytochrome P450